MLNINDIIEGEVSAIAFGGEGVIRHAGFVIFVPFTAIGEVVRVQIAHMHSSFARGVILEVVKTSPMRIAARCPNFGKCGGCQFQHLQMAEQLKIKKQLLADALERIGRFDEMAIGPVKSAAMQWEYRRHITLHLEPSSQGYRPGYVAMDNKSILTIDECAIFEAKSSPLLAYLQGFVCQIEAREQNPGRVTIFKCDQNGWICHFQFAYMPRNFASAVEQAMQQKSLFTGIIATTQKETLSWGAAEIFFKQDPFNFVASPLAFMQNHPEQSAHIYRHICDCAKELKIKKVLDLYCGIGLASVMLSQGGISSVAVECNIEAIKLAERNAAINDAHAVRFIQADVQKVLKNLLKIEKPDLALLNPPRQGLRSKILHILLKSPPKHLLYISCMPATLARDLKVLCEKKYQIRSLQPFDMFPQTTHLETVVHLSSYK